VTLRLGKGKVAGVITGEDEVAVAMVAEQAVVEGAETLVQTIS
jgi:hypothetical protein